MNNTIKKIIVAVTGASGSVYARLFIEKLLEIKAISEIAVVFSNNGVRVSEYERQDILPLNSDSRIKVYSNHDMFSSPASGSARYDAMVIIPCSAGTMGRVANGISGDLISRAADVMLKERRKLLMVLRETPLSTIHLKNMLTLSEAGCIVMPASPSFYSHPANIEELCMTVIERILCLLGFNFPSYEWDGGTKPQTLPKA